MLVKTTCLTVINECDAILRGNLCKHELFFSIFGDNATLHLRLHVWSNWIAQTIGCSSNGYAAPPKKKP